MAIQFRFKYFVPAKKRVFDVGRYNIVYAFVIISEANDDSLLVTRYQISEIK